MSNVIRPHWDHKTVREHGGRALVVQRTDFFADLSIHRRTQGPVPICRALSLHGVQIGPRTYSALLGAPVGRTVKTPAVGHQGRRDPGRHPPSRRGRQTSARVVVRQPAIARAAARGGFDDQDHTCAIRPWRVSLHTGSALATVWSTIGGTRRRPNGAIDAPIAKPANTRLPGTAQRRGCRGLQRSVVAPATCADAPCSLIQPMPWIHQGTFRPWCGCPASAGYC